MPNRILRDWTDSDVIEKLTSDAEVFFVRLIMKADDYGRFHAEARRLKSACFPLRDSTRNTDISRWLAECEAAGLIRCYDANGGRFLCIHKFDQRLRLKKERFPRPPVSWLANDGHASKPFVSTSDSDSQQGKGSAEGETQSAAMQLRREIGEHFKRGPGDRWGYDEETLLVEACKSPTVIQEWHTILGYRTARKEYQRQSLLALLQNWTGELDKARNYEPEAHKYGNGNNRRGIAENPRNAGIVRGTTDYGALAKRHAERGAQTPVAPAVAEDSSDAPATESPGGLGL